MEFVGAAKKTGPINRPTLNEAYNVSSNKIWGVVGPMYYSRWE